MWELRSSSAVTRCEYVEGGVLLARHSGIFGHPEARSIVPRLAASYCDGIIERYDGAITIFSEEAKQPEYRVPDIPWALIVREDQYHQAVEFCTYLATCGVMRTAWLPQHVDLALRWCSLQIEARAPARDMKSAAASPFGRLSTGGPLGWSVREDPVVWPQTTRPAALEQRL